LNILLGFKFIKVIFDRIEPLKPWGILLGDDMENPKKTPRKKIKK